MGPLTIVTEVQHWQNSVCYSSTVIRNLLYASITTSCIHEIRHAEFQALHNPKCYVSTKMCANITLDRPIMTLQHPYSESAAAIGITGVEAV